MTSSTDPAIRVAASRVATVLYAVVVAASFAAMFIAAASLIPAFGPVVGGAGAFAVLLAALYGLHRLTGWMLDVACRFSSWMVNRRRASSDPDNV